ncbi:hypothetical protein JANAI62_25820 [Jannaschia pagri]|uniref:EAL domain-containing protein n=1 Tax=Jannaschia pagri TaxID=2829797 RepID=A0ABQ4NNK2_9RHOB|nr:MULTISPECIES: EAL domain-containing protein [unclassified Jannaschia]GIT92124.1 hypothetical protein JANAI61_25820 [Jannaschia sp. AI_61]GIT95959.1 hypothetical protein JANAI62_25820 [Jannaschia sp. AI_62]
MLQQNINLASAAPAADDMADALIDQALAAVRDHMGMPIAYLSEFVGDTTVFRHVNAPGLEGLIKPGDTRSLDEVYCKHILSGDLPELIQDTSALPLARSLPITQAAPIGSHASLPVRRADGSVYGMFCCLSPDPNPDLTHRDLKVMGMFAELAAEQIRMRLARQTKEKAASARIAAVIQARDFDVVYQPLYRLSDGGLASFEALCRFRPAPYRSPDKWFNEAAGIGLQRELELAVIEMALTGLDALPYGTRLAVNISPKTVAEGGLLPLLRQCDARRVTVEITEHEDPGDIEKLVMGLQGIRGTGAAIAVDDVGAGYSGLQQILRIQPDVLKLDMSLVRDIDRDPARRSLATALLHFAQETKAAVVAEGIERPEEWHLLAQLGVTYGQGWLMAKPGRIADAPLRVDPHPLVVSDPSR